MKRMIAGFCAFALFTPMGFAQAILAPEAIPTPDAVDFENCGEGTLENCADHAEQPDLLAAPFDPDEYSKNELKFIQAALVQTGFYKGLIDGEWGPGSDAALAEYAAQSATDVNGYAVGSVVFEANDYLTAEGWHMEYIEPFGMSFLVPEGFGSYATSDDQTVYSVHETDDEKIWVALMRGGRVETADMQDRAIKKHHSDELIYLFDNDEMRIISYRDDVGQGGQKSTGYLRSNRAADGFNTIWVQEFGETTYRSQLIISSLTNDPDAKIAFDEYGRLAEVQRLVFESYMTG